MADIALSTVLGTDPETVGSRLAALEARPVAAYTSTNTTTKINEATAVVVPFNSALIADAGYSLAGGIVTVAAAGRYRITGHVHYSVPVGQRIQVEVKIAIDGVATGVIGDGGYVRGTDDVLTATASVVDIVDLSAGDQISITSQRSGAAADATLVSGTSRLLVERIG